MSKHAKEKEIPFWLYLAAALSAIFIGLFTWAETADAAPNKPALSISFTDPDGTPVNEASWGDYAYVEASGLERLERPMYYIKCTQNGEFVYGTTYRDLLPEYPVYEPTYSILRSTLWAGGAADCTASLIDLYSGGGKFPKRVITSLDFQVIP
jgi:hypothetical protein